MITRMSGMNAFVTIRITPCVHRADPVCSRCGLVTRDLSAKGGGDAMLCWFLERNRLWIIYPLCKGEVLSIRELPPHVRWATQRRRRRQVIESHSPLKWDNSGAAGKSTSLSMYIHTLFIPTLQRKNFRHLLGIIWRIYGFLHALPSSNTLRVRPPKIILIINK